MPHGLTQEGARMPILAVGAARNKNCMRHWCLVEAGYAGICSVSAHAELHPSPAVVSKPATQRIEIRRERWMKGSICIVQWPSQSTPDIDGSDIFGRIFLASASGSRALPYGPIRVRRTCLLLVEPASDSNSLLGTNDSRRRSAIGASFVERSRHAPHSAHS